MDRKKSQRVRSKIPHTPSRTVSGLFPLYKPWVDEKSECPACADLPLSEKHPVQVQVSFQFRFPRSKRKRIRNKWAKQNRNFKTHPSTFLVHLQKPVFDALLSLRNRKFDRWQVT